MGYLRVFSTIISTWTLALQRASGQSVVLRTSKGAIGIATLESVFPSDVTTKVLLRDMVVWRSPIRGAAHAMATEAVRRAGLAGLSTGTALGMINR